MPDTAQALLTFIPDDYCLVSLMRQRCVCSCVRVFISLLRTERLDLMRQTLPSPLRKLYLASCRYYGNIINNHVPAISFPSVQCYNKSA